MSESKPPAVMLEGSKHRSPPRHTSHTQNSMARCPRTLPPISASRPAAADSSSTRQGVGSSAKSARARNNGQPRRVEDSFCLPPLSLPPSPYCSIFMPSSQPFLLEPFLEWPVGTSCRAALQQVIGPPRRRQRMPSALEIPRRLFSSPLALERSGPRHLPGHLDPPSSKTGHHFLRRMSARSDIHRNLPQEWAVPDPFTASLNARPVPERPAPNQDGYSSPCAHGKTQGSARR